LGFPRSVTPRFALLAFADESLGITGSELFLMVIGFLRGVTPRFARLAIANVISGVTASELSLVFLPRFFVVQHREGL
jgi:hypothetical protein